MEGRDVREEMLWDVRSQILGLEGHGGDFGFKCVTTEGL